MGQNIQEFAIWAIFAIVLGLLVLISIVNGRLRKKLRPKRATFFATNPLKAFEHKEFYVLVCLFAFLLVSIFIGGSLILSGQSCIEKVKSDSEARQALALFLTSNTSASRRLIAELRKDGLRDEYLIEMQSGCLTCVVGQGRRPSEDV